MEKLLIQNQINNDLFGNYVNLGFMVMLFNMHIDKTKHRENQHMRTGI